MFLLNSHWFGIGDQVVCSSVPENIYQSTGKKCVIVNHNVWPFKHNPYVIYSNKKDLHKDIINLHLPIDDRNSEYFNSFFKLHHHSTVRSQAEMICFFLGIYDIVLHHPRLYVYEDENINPNKIVVHTTGSARFNSGDPPIHKKMGEDSVRVMSDDIIQKILNNYKDYHIVQIGAASDKPLGGNTVDMRGKLSYWETAKEIATSSKFIGINSGPMHIANCYPRVEKRIVLQEFSEDALIKFRPGDMSNWTFQWLDPSCMYLNKYDRDITFSKSYHKI